MLFGTVRLAGRQQPFTPRLQSLGKRLLVRCVSPVGRVGPEDAQEDLLAAVATHSVRIGAVSLLDQGTFDLTVQDDVLLADDQTTDSARVAMLVWRVAIAADELEQRCLPGHDEALRAFREQLEEEARHGR
jgi:hypothetical protein